MKEFPFDTMMYPINFGIHYINSYEVEALKEAKERGLGILAIKPMARQKWPANADRSVAKGCWYEPLFDPQQAKLALYSGRCPRREFQWRSRRVTKSCIEGHSSSQQTTLRRQKSRKHI